MKKRVWTFRLLTCSLLPAVLFVASASAFPAQSAGADKIKKAHIQRAYGKLPMYFVRNDGQMNKEVRFYERGSGHTTFFTMEGVSLSLTDWQKEALGRQKEATEENVTGIRKTAKIDSWASEDQKVKNKYLQMSFTEYPEPLRNQQAINHNTQIIKLIPLNPNNDREIIAEGLQNGTANYFIGNNPKRWKSNIPTYNAIVYKKVYDGIDMKFYGTNSHLKYDIIVKPGADLSKVRLSYEGITDLNVTNDGDMEVRLRHGTLIQKKPYIYQEINGEKVEVEGKFILHTRDFPGYENNKTTNNVNEQVRCFYGFQVAPYDKTRTLIVDPTLIYSTILGGNGSDVGMGIAIDNSGNAYLTGFTQALGSTFPTKNAYQESHAGGTFDAFVAKINAFGNDLIYSTYLGGNGGNEKGLSIAIDNSGNAYVTGETDSTNFPTQNAYQSAYGGGERDSFITKLNASGNALVYSTYLGGNSLDQGWGIAVDDSGNAYITGETFSTNFPTQNAYQSDYGGGDSDGFITKLNAFGNALVYSTYLGGSGDDSSRGISVDNAGNTYVTGGTSSSNFPLQNPYQWSLDPGQPGVPSSRSDVFVTKLNSSGGELSYSTYLGGNGGDGGLAIAIDNLRNAYITGGTDSTNFPVQNPYQASLSGIADVFVTKLNSSGSELRYSTYLGGSHIDRGWGIAVDDSGNAYITGDTFSTNFPTENAYQSNHAGGNSDAFITKLFSTGSTLSYSTYLGGSNSEHGEGIAVDNSGNAYVTGGGSGRDFPTTNNANQESPIDGEGFFITKIGEERPYFTNVTAEVGMSNIPAFRVSIADVNNDGYPDILLHERANEGAGDVLDKQFLYLNVQGDDSDDPFSRKFIDFTADSGIRENRRGTNEGRHSSFAVFADVDNDGDLDMFSGLHAHSVAEYADIGDRNDLFLNDGNGHFTLSSDMTFHDDGILNTSSATFLDYDRDGNIDLFVGNWFAGFVFGNQFFSDQLYRGHGDGSFSNVTDIAGLNFELPTYSVSAADVNNDGWIDLFAPVYCRAQSIHWENNGDGTFTQVQQNTDYGKFIGPGFGSGSVGRQSCSWGSMPRDFDNDGDIDFLELMVHGSDIIYNGERRPSSALLVNQLVETGNNLFTWKFISRPNDPDPTHHRDHYGSWLDIDNDGLADFVLSQTDARDSDDDQIDLFRQLANHTFDIVTPNSGWHNDINESKLNPHNVTPFDYDLDGDEDLLIGFTDADGIQLWKNDTGNSNNWIAISLEGGGPTNRSAIGARVEVLAGGTIYSREISAGNGHFGPQAPLNLTFGLGQVTKVDTVKIHWPNKNQSSMEFHDIPVNQFMHIRKVPVIEMIAFVSQHPNDSVAVIDLNTNTVTDVIPVGNVANTGPIAVALSPDGTRLYAANDGESTVSIVDVLTMAEMDTDNDPGNGVTPIALPSNSNARDIAITPDGMAAYITDFAGGGQRVFRIDLATNGVLQIPNVGRRPAFLAITPDGSKAYVTNHTSRPGGDPSHSVTVIDTATNTVSDSIQMTDRTLRGIAIHPEGNRAYVCGEDGVSTLDLSSNTIIEFEPNRAHAMAGIAVSPDGSRVYASSLNRDVLIVFATTDPGAELEEIARIDIERPRLSFDVGIDVSADGSRVYVTSSMEPTLENAVAVIDAETLTVIDTIEVAGVTDIVTLGALFPPAELAEADTYIRTDLDERRNDNYGRQNFLEVGTSRGGGGTILGDPDAMRALIRFDLTDVPADDPLVNAALELTVDSYDQGSSSSVYTLDVHRIVDSGRLTPWVEGNGFEGPLGDPLNISDAPPLSANVNNAFGVAWEGIDANNQNQPAFDPAVSASAVIDQGVDGPGDVIRWDITTLVQDWLNGRVPNFGIMLRDVTTDGTFRGVRFGAREGELFKIPNAVAGPRLVLTFEEEAEGDLDGDGDVDRDDLDLILAVRNTSAVAPNDPRDLDGDGMITVLDARILVILCTRDRCKTENQ